MTLRRVMLVVVVVLLVLCSALAGVVAADWPYLRRVIAVAGMADAGEWPDSFYTPVVRIDGGGGAPPFPRGGDSIDPAALEAAARWAGEHGTVALLVLHRGRLVLERYWDGQAPDAPFSGRAMSRSLLGLAYGAAIERGLLALDDPAGKWLEEWRADPRGAITVRQLMQNVSGLEEAPLASPLPPAGAGALQRLVAIARTWADRNARLSLGNDFAGAALRFPLVHAPGTRFAHSNVNSQLLGLILERVTGMSYERWFAEVVWEPLGAGVGEFYMDRESGMPATYCCFRAVPRDWLRLGALLAGDGALDGRQVLPRGWVQRLASDTSNVNPRYGLQVWSGRAARGLREYQPGSGFGVRHGEDFLADDAIWMEGGGGRSIWAFPSEALVIVRLGRGAPGWDGSVLPNTLLRGLRGAVQPGAGR
ncbi:MAG: beta-lactamase family protein [Steroidobacteraceae bacterium]|jgi:CubicO group peptidase (beta-lactamase class C family)|nr:beta-lactamase family protein [Steroidobacteraceae bacterium]